MENQEKRFLLALVLSFAFLFVYTTWIAPPSPKPAVPASTPGPQSSAAAPVSETATPPPVTVPALSASSKPIPATPLLAENEYKVQVRTPYYQLALTNRGAALASLRLSHFRQNRKDPASLVELVPQGADPPPLQARLVGGPDLSKTLFVTESENLELEAGESGTVKFRTRTSEGIEITKEFSFSGDDYAIGCVVGVLNAGTIPFQGKVVLEWGSGLGTATVGGSAFGGGAPVSGPVLLFNGEKLETLKEKKLQGETAFPVPRWIATHDQYFLAALLPKQGVDAALASSRGKGLGSIGLSSPLQLMPGSAGGLSAVVYAGPKEMDSLKKVDETLTRSVELGIFSFLAKPILLLLHFLYRFVGNYGIAIILLAVLLKLVLLPISTGGYKSMRKMAELQPRINALREKYRKDREAMNQAIMQLYQENKVNPATGCFQMLLQIPVFLALYKALMGAIELRHAPFVFWIQDLSAKDPWYITPIIMGATMFLQQKMTPTTMDPKQAQIMTFMPVIFTVFFINVPSGLVLYWTVTNILSIGHQFLMMKGDIKPAEVTGGKKKKKS